MRIAARRFDGRSSARQDVEIEVGADAILWIHGPGEAQQLPLSAVKISTRLGSIPRIITLPDSSSCEVADNDALDRALQDARSGAAAHWVDRLERRWAWALSGMVVVIALVVTTALYGIPAAARYAAEALPPEMDRALGNGSLDAVDGRLFTTSELDLDRQIELQAMFADMVSELNDEHGYRLELRHSRQFGANAFALPSGIVIMTDDLVRIAAHDDELKAVLAHEIGHVVNRHSLRMVLQGSATALLMLALLGDLNTATALVAAAPGVLVQAKHSRQFETEADEYAYAWLDHHGIPRKQFADILQRLEAKTTANGKLLGFLSTHPRTEERRRD